MTRRITAQARRKVQMTMRKYMEDEINAVFHPLPGTGKTTGFIKNVADLDVQASLLQPTRKLRKEAVEKAEAHGISYVNIPSFPDSSPLMDEDSAWYSSRAENWYSRGMPPREIYERIGDDIPENEDAYKAAINEDWSDVQLLIGDVHHLYLDTVVQDRVLAIDDVDPVQKLTSTYVLDPEHRNFDDALQDEISEYLVQHQFPVTTLHELESASSSKQQRCLQIAQQNPSWKDIPDTHHVRSKTSEVVQAICRATDYDTRTDWLKYWDRCISGAIKKVAYQGGGVLGITSIPTHVDQCSALYVLDATPNRPLLDQWHQDLNMMTRYEGCLDGREAHYLEEMGYKVFQTSNYLNSRHGYNRPTTSSRVKQMKEMMEDALGEEPAVIDSLSMHEQYDFWEDDTNEGTHFAETRGINDFADKNVGLVAGTTHYGDDYIKRYAAYCGVDATVERPEGEEGTWQDPVSREIHAHMTEAEVFQAMMRFGRNTDGEKYIWIDTKCIPDFVPRTKPAQGVDNLVVKNKGSVMDVWEKLDEGLTSAKELAQDSEFSLRSIYRALEELTERGYVRVEKDSGHYNADEFEKAASNLADGADVTEQLTSALSTSTIRKCQKLQDHRTTERDLHGHVVEAMGISASSPIPEDFDSGQLALTQFN